LGGGGLGNVLVLAWELLNIVCGRKVCMLMRDRRLVGPEEPLDLVVPVLWDDRDDVNPCRSASSLESAGGESSRCLYQRIRTGAFTCRSKNGWDHLRADSPDAIHLLPMLIHKGSDGVRGNGI